MTRDDIIRMAREAGLLAEDDAWVSPYQEAMERFAALVAAAERERLQKPWVKTYTGGKPNYTTPESGETK